MKLKTKIIFLLLMCVSRTRPIKSETKPILSLDFGKSITNITSRAPKPFLRPWPPRVNFPAQLSGVPLTSSAYSVAYRVPDSPSTMKYSEKIQKSNPTIPKETCKFTTPVLPCHCFPVSARKYDLLENGLILLNNISVIPPDIIISSPRQHQMLNELTVFITPKLCQEER